MAAALTQAHKTPPAQSKVGVIVYHPPKGVRSSSGTGTLQPNASTNPPGISPAQMRHAYGIDQVTFGTVQGSGAGQTIAIIDAYDSPTAFSDLQHFDQQFNLPDPPQFTRVAQDGSTNYPSTDPNTGKGGSTWETETDLDLQWAHAMAPQASLLLVEATDSSDDNLITAAVGYARAQPGVSVVSMSFGGSEFSGEDSVYGGIFTTPAGHNGITFVASTGDGGAPAEYPAFSANVVGVGGTTLNIDSSGNYISESGWSGSGGSISTVLSQPSYQNGVVTQSTRHRTAPDVAMDADPNTGVPVYDSYDNASAPWIQVGGTSLAAPLWSGLMAVVNQGRVVNGMATLNGRNDTLPRLYALPAADFHDITTGNNGNAAGPGYDLVTGRGSPVANKLVYDLAGISATTAPAPLTISGTASSDVIYLKRDGAILDVWLNASQPGTGTPTNQYVMANISAITVAGGGGSDNVVFDESAGDILTVPTNVNNAAGSVALTLIGSTQVDTLAINGDANSITFNSHTLNFANVSTISYWDSIGGDNIQSSGSIPVTLNVMDDNINVASGTVTINFVDPGAGPAFSSPLTPAISQPTVAAAPTGPTPATRKPYRPARPHRPAQPFSVTRI